MKTTIDIADPLISEAKKIAVREGTTVKALVELALRRIIAEKKGKSEFKLTRASFKGEGIQPALQDASWETLRELAYKGHGG